MCHMSQDVQIVIFVGKNRENDVGHFFGLLTRILRNICIWYKHFSTLNTIFYFFDRSLLTYVGLSAV